MNPRDDVLSTNVKYKPFKTFVRMTWDSEPRMVQAFTHSLTQYTPSAYAEIALTYPKKDINTFLKIEETPIVERNLVVSCVTENFGANTLYDNDLDSKIFGGPWLLICIQYNINPSKVSMFTDEIDPTPEESYTITLKCVDRVWYSMTQEEKFGVFSRRKYQSIHDCVDYILDQHKAKEKFIEPTTVSFNWLQNKMTDYEFIRSVLAYTNPPGFHFFCNNNKGYFKPIGVDGCIPGELEINLQGAGTGIIASIINKQYLEKVSEGAVIVPFGEGLNDNTHNEKDSNPMGGSGKQSGGQRFITVALDNPAIKEAFSANVRFRTKMFGRVAKIETNLLTDYTPLNTIKVVNNAPEKYPTFASGEYYIISIKNCIGFNSTFPFIPHSWIVISRGGD
jgi:hypothetical protein